MKNKLGQKNKQNKPPKTNKQQKTNQATPNKKYQVLLRNHLTVKTRPNFQHFTYALLLLLLLLLLRRFNRVQLCVTPQTAAYQALPSTGVSRQEYWIGLPLPSPTYALSLPKKYLTEKTLIDYSHLFSLGAQKLQRLRFSTNCLCKYWSQNNVYLELTAEIQM